MSGQGACLLWLPGPLLCGHSEWRFTEAVIMWPASVQRNDVEVARVCVLSKYEQQGLHPVWWCCTVRGVNCM